MKFLDYLFHGKELRYIDSYFKMLNGYSPTFTSYNGGVYEMDLTRTAVNRVAPLSHWKRHYSISPTILWTQQNLLSVWQRM